MGRYYSGDINGKFWFGVQASDAADRFGVAGEAPNYIEYYYDESNLPSVEAEIKAIEKTLGNYKVEFDNFFDSVNSYNDTTLEEKGLLGAWNKHKVDYADLQLGYEIRDCIKENGSCQFEAEL